MKKNNSKSQIFPLAVTMIFLQGCSNNEEKFWGFGSFVFVVFLFVLFLKSAIPRLQEIPRLEQITEKLKELTKRLLPLFFSSAFALIGYGMYSILSSGTRSRQDLIIFIGAIVLYIVINIKGWTQAEEVLAQRNYLRMAGLGISFLLVFIYLISGAPNLDL